LSQTGSRTASLRRLRLISPLCLALGLIAAAQPVPGQPATGQPATGPVAIRSYQLFSPPELAGTGIAPEVEIRVKVDVHGAVAQVDVLTIEPSSRFDQFLQLQVARNVGAWRFGPARDEEGNAVASTLTWRMKFQGRERGGTGERFRLDRNRFDPQLDALVSAGALPMAAAPPPLAEQARILNRTIEAAEQYVDPEHRQRRQTERFILVSDAEDETTVDVLAANMEAVLQTFRGLFDPHIEPLPPRFRIVVYLYRREAQLNRLQLELSGRSVGAGFYYSPGLLAFHQEVADSDQLLHTMLHEAFHSFSDTYLTGPGSDLPRWAEEGLAEYFGNSKIERGRLIPGKMDRGRYAIVHGRRGATRLRSLAQWNLDEARSALQGGQAPSIAQLLEATEDTFYGERIRHYYGFSWLFVHFLHHGREEWETGQTFARMLLYLAEGYVSEDALAALFGTTPEELQPEFDQYVRRL